MCGGYCVFFLVVVVSVVLVVVEVVVVLMVCVWWCVVWFFLGVFLVEICCEMRKLMMLMLMISRNSRIVIVEVLLRLCWKNVSFYRNRIVVWNCWLLLLILFVVDMLNSCGLVKICSLLMVVVMIMKISVGWIVGIVMEKN